MNKSHKWASQRQQNGGEQAIKALVNIYRYEKAEVELRRSGTFKGVIRVENRMCSAPFFAEGVMAVAVELEEERM